jgi:hypothetical protein
LTRQQCRGVWVSWAHSKTGVHKRGRLGERRGWRHGTDMGGRGRTGVSNFTMRRSRSCERISAVCWQSMWKDAYTFTLVSEILASRVLWLFENREKSEKSKKSENLWNTFLVSNPLPIFVILIMVCRMISPDLKQRALYLLLEEGWEIDQLTTALVLHSKNTKRWEHNCECHGSVNPPTPL